MTEPSDLDIARLLGEKLRAETKAPHPTEHAVLDFGTYYDDGNGSDLRDAAIDGRVDLVGLVHVIRDMTSRGTASG